MQIVPAHYSLICRMKVPFEVIYEDNHLLIVNKAAGILVQGDSTGDVPLVAMCKDYIGAKYEKPGAVFLGVVHRIDRPVSGVVVFARTSKALERMNALFRDKKTKKTYWAIAENKPPAETGHLVHWLSKDARKNKTTVFVRDTPGALRSELGYQVLSHAAKRPSAARRSPPSSGKPATICARSSPPVHVLRSFIETTWSCSDPRVTRDPFPSREASWPSCPCCRFQAGRHSTN